jgi:hypothetical protein
MKHQAKRFFLLPFPTTCLYRFTSNTYLVFSLLIWLCRSFSDTKISKRLGSSILKLIQEMFKMFPLPGKKLAWSSLKKEKAEMKPIWTWHEAQHWQVLPLTLAKLVSPALGQPRLLPVREAVRFKTRDGAGRRCHLCRNTGAMSCTDGVNF